MKKRRDIVRFGIAVAVAAFASPVVAAVETFVADYGAAASPLAVGSSENLSLGKFDPFLGTLIGVNLTLFSYDTVCSRIYNLTGESANYTQATATVPITVTALDSLTTAATGTAGPFAGTSTAPGVSVAGGTPVIALHSTASVSPADFGFYEGVGVLPFNVTVVNSVGTYSGDSGSLLFFGGSGLSYGMVEIDYIYADTPNRAQCAQGWPRSAFVALNLPGGFGASAPSRVDHSIPAPDQISFEDGQLLR